MFKKKVAWGLTLEKENGFVSPFIVHSVTCHFGMLRTPAIAGAVKAKQVRPCLANSGLVFFMGLP